MPLKRIVKKAKPKKEDDKQNSKGEGIKSESLKSILGKSKDVKFWQIYIGEGKSLPIVMVYIDGLASSNYISDYILKPLVQEEVFKNIKTTKEAIKLIEGGTIYYPSVKTRYNIEDTVGDILTGSIALVFDSENIALTFEIKGFDKRSITEPSGENVIKGSRDTFVEILRTNTAIIRQKIKSPNLIIEETIVGRQTLTPIAIIYMDNIANTNIIDELKRKLDNISIDNALSTAFVEELMMDTNTVFPKIVYTERPDKFCSNIVEGRVGLIIDGIPSSMIIPGTLIQFLQAPEDYSQNYIISSAVRFLRVVLMFLTLFLPGFYISVTTFHQEMIPTKLALSIDASKEGVPFPTFIEVLFMLIAFEVLVEAGLRLPKSIGQAVSIVGAIVVGQAAVSAKLVSPAVVIVLAITAISGYTSPNVDLLNALRIWRFIIGILSSIMGLFGMSIGGLILLFHLSKIEVLGVPYLSPFVSNEGQQLEDTIFRLPISFFKKRPDNLKTKNKRRQR